MPETEEINGTTDQNSNDSDHLLHPKLTYEIQRQIDEAHWNPNIRIETTEDINTGYCRAFAANVLKGLDVVDVDIVHISGYKGSHYWLRCDGRHYDAEKPRGVDDYANLPYWQRNGIPDFPVSVVTHSIIAES